MQKFSNLFEHTIGSLRLFGKMSHFLKKNEPNPSALIFSGSSHSFLAQEMSDELCLPMGKRKIGNFPDGETCLEIYEDIAHKEIFLFQSLAFLPNHFLVELLLFIDALKKGFAKKITLILPYLGYSRQDTEGKSFFSPASKLIANLLNATSVDRIITFDLHSKKNESFFQIPVTNLHAQALIAAEAIKHLEKPFVVVAPDFGSIPLAKRAAKILDCEIVTVCKQRIDPYKVRSTLMGEVKDKQVLLIDDICSTGSTLLAAAELCKTSGAKKIVAGVTHGLLVENAIQKIDKSPIKLLITTNSVESLKKDANKMVILSVAPMLKEAILRTGFREWKNPSKTLKLSVSRK